MMNIIIYRFHFRWKYLFEDITFKLGNGDRISYNWKKNGAGKSTMLKILSKEVRPDTGKLLQIKSLKWLKQDIDFVLGTERFLKNIGFY
jgi:ATP-binding cassette subfamily F protein 3